MAKEAVSPIERHIEKGVLAITVLLFIGVGVKYLVSSPNTMPVGQRQVGPAEIYQIVGDEAIQLRDRIRGTRKEVITPEPPDLSSPAVQVAALQIAVPFGPHVPRIQTRNIGNLELLSVARMAKPIVFRGRSGAVLTPPMPITAMPDEIDEYYKSWNDVPSHEMSDLFPVNWVTIAATIDLAEQRRRADDKLYPPGRAVPYPVGADLQRREVRWDGTTGEWEDVKPYAPLTLPELPYLEVTQQDGTWAVTDDQRLAIDTFFNKVVRDDYLRLELVRPMPPPIAYGDWWLHDRIEEAFGVDLRRHDDEFWWGNEVGNCPFYNRYPEPKKPPRQNNEPDYRKIIAEELAKLEDWLSQGCFDAIITRLDKDLRITSWDYFNDREKEDANSIYDRAVRQKSLREAQPPGPREVSPTQIVWVHDTLPDSVVSGRTYEYRMRALLFNPFAGATAELKDPHDAEVALLEGEWSPASDEVSIPYDTEFFLVGRKERDATGKIDVFRWHEGTWVKDSFHVSLGDSIGGREYVRIGGSVNQPKVPVEFTTGATVVDLNFDRTYRPRKVRRGVVTLGKPKKTVAMVYLDSSGGLHERLLDVDKRSERYRELKSLSSRPTGGPGPGRP
ncbi:MAG: hypothetical protein GY842_28890 [bacterium]|nr:hypothetical protein [bacterium]